MASCAAWCFSGAGRERALCEEEVLCSYYELMLGAVVKSGGLRGIRSLPVHALPTCIVFAARGRYSYGNDIAAVDAKGGCIDEGWVDKVYDSV